MFHFNHFVVNHIFQYIQYFFKCFWLPTCSLISIEFQYLPNGYPAIVLIRPILINKDISDIKLSTNAKFCFNISLNIIIRKFCKVFCLFLIVNIIRLLFFLREFSKRQFQSLKIFVFKILTSILERLLNRIKIYTYLIKTE